MIPSIALWLIGKGVPDRLAKPLMIFGAALIALMLIALAIRIHDKRVISTNDAVRAAKEAPIIRKADENAATQRAADQKRTDHDEAELHAALAPLAAAPLTDRQRARACAILRQQRGAQHADAAGC